MAIDPEDVTSSTYYDEHQADPRSDYDEIKSGLRAHATQACQYWIKGVSALCKYWDDAEDKCTYMDQFDATATVAAPSGYNNNKCDYLGRRFSCNKYETEAEDDLDTYWCVAPNIFLTGLGTHTVDENGKPLLTPIPKSEIQGYCAGRCDEQGRGTGCGGTPGSTPIVCGYYRPFQMGFGADEPHGIDYYYDDSFPKQRVIEADAITRAYAAAITPMEKRLPFAFKLYNLRAHFQKCGYWDDVTGAKFQEPTSASGIHLDIDPADYCTSLSASATPYYTIATPGGLGIAEWLLKEVWCEGGTVICNGAKPECPCYTGKWLYLNDEKMQEGMRITADQIFELRFWTVDWGTQAEYDAFFLSHPNFGDATSTSVYTFTKWHRLSIPEESQMQGRKLDMCMPAILNQREFDPDLYLTINEILYPLLGVDIGTSSPNKNQVFFPTLIRDPDTEDMYIRPLSIIYPYSSSDPFSTTESCEDRGDPICIKPTCRMDFDELTVVGSTVAECDVYAINLNYFKNFDCGVYPEGCVPEFEEHKQVSTISTLPRINNDDDPTLAGLSPREAFFIRLKRFIDFCDMWEPDAIAKGTSDEKGFFKIGPTNLEIGALNEVVICVEFSDHTWDFRIRDVVARWYGGVLLQSTFDAGVNVGGRDYLPESFSTPPVIDGVTRAWSSVVSADTSSNPGMECTLDSIISVASKKYVDRIGEEKYEYSYCVKKKTLSDITVDTWARIGQSTYVWLDMLDLRINHLFEWEIDSVEMLRTEEEEEESCAGVANSVEMEVVDIETFVSGKLSVPPGARILKPKDDIIVGFFNSDWTLSITYWYKYIDTDNSVSDNEVITWPDFTDPNIVFTQSDLTITVEETGVVADFTVSDIEAESVALMTYFVDADSERLISSFATKLIVQVVKVECRNVEISYSYDSPAIGWAIQPDTSQAQLADVRLPDLQLSAPYRHYYKPPCGDHRLSNITGKGPCWYPFTACEDVDFYQEFAGGAFCTNNFPGTPRNDMRLCAAPEYKAFVAQGGGLADCVLPWHYRYSVVSDILFAGYVNIVHQVNIFEYAFEEWTLPPFGNRGREMTTRWLSTDHWAHTTYKDTSPPSTKKQWVPMVPDLSDFFVSFNAFDEAYEADLFSFTSQLNFMLNYDILETMEREINPDLSEGDYSRARFEDVYGIHTAAFATYPPPIYVTGDIQKVAFYYFKDSEVAWAWRELWKDIEYVFTQEQDDGREYSARALFFITYEKPDYVYGYDKNEYRYICDEGTYTIYLGAPVITENELITFPYIRLGNAGKKRYFEIRYDTYDDDYVDWKDENSGEVGGSGGESDSAGTESDKGNIYEQTSGSDWSHDENIIFDEYAVKTKEEADTAGRKIDTIDPLTGDITYTYFNRGIIAYIKKNVLKYLPCDEELAVAAGSEDDSPVPVISPVPESGGDYSVEYAYYHVSPIYTYYCTIHPEDPAEQGEVDLEDGKCISRVVITGTWGIYGTDKLCKPGVIITADGTELYNLEEVSTDIIFTGAASTSRIPFRIEINLDPTPDRMIGLEEEFKIQLINCPQHWIAVNKFELFVVSYKSDTELIKVWERKYNYSKSNKFGDFSLNGPKVDGVFPLQYEVDRDNAGVYFPASPQIFSQFWGEVAARDKMRSVFASQQYIEDESITVTADNLTNIEQNEQKNLYKDAYDRDVDGDLTVFDYIVSPPFEEFLGNIGLPQPFVVAQSFDMKKIAWEDHYLVASYNDGVVWMPGGHKYQWGDKVELIFCYEIALGHTQGAEAYRRYTIFEVQYYHLDSASPDTVTNAPNALRSSRMLYQLVVAAKAQAAIDVAGTADPLSLADTYVDNNVAVSGARA